jgi:hypothetical protein
MAISRRSGSAAERLPTQEWVPPLRRRRPLRTAFQVIGIILLTILGMVALALVCLNLAEDWIRGYAEAQLNLKLQGYSFTIGRLDLHPFGLSLDLENLTVAEKTHPHPPIAHIPKHHASLQWRKLLQGDVLSDHRMERPAFHFTRAQAQKEKEKVKEAVAEQKPKQWQDAITSIYPVTINELKVEGAEFTYVDGPEATPVKLVDLNLRLSNVKNVRSQPGDYPSSLHVDARLGEGQITIDGKSDLMADPLPDVHTDLRLEKINLGQLLSIAARWHLYLDQGSLTADGHLQTTKDKRLVTLRHLTLDRVRADYIHVTKASLVEKAGEKAVQATERGQRPGNGQPTTVVKIADAQIKDSEFGLVNKAATPQYRVFLADVDAKITNLSNRPSDGTGFIALKAKFMGSGDTHLTAAFRPETKSPDFDLNLRIVDTRLSAMNDLLRAHGKFDVAKGQFTLYTELMVRDGQVQGYIKPLLQGVDVYNRKQDRGKPVLKQVYEGVVGGVSGLLKNQKTDAVATKAKVSGRLDNPDMKTWETLALVIRNAFFQAILPGFDADRG